MSHRAIPNEMDPHRSYGSLESSMAMSYFVNKLIEHKGYKMGYKKNPIKPKKAIKGGK